MKNVTKEIKFGESHTKSEILVKITNTKSKISELQEAFNSNPCTKTATPLSNQKQFLEFLQTSIRFTSEEIAEQKKRDQKFYSELVQFTIDLKSERLSHF